MATALAQNTKSHISLIAIQPYSIPPFSAAKMIHTFTHLYQRKLYINMVIGSFPYELSEIGDVIDKKQRYDRLIEYTTTIVQSLLRSNEPFSFQGDYYNYINLLVRAAVQDGYMPKVFIASGTTSFDGLGVAQQIGDVLLTIPKSLSDYKSSFPDHIKQTYRGLGIKIRLICKPSSEEALKAAKDSKNFRLREL